ncbi:unnamed protein product [Brassicogethes aeneus]|uniref:Peptidase S1 domain-containing protein n=1 Tax=Brassicogethes aeneus TaxID=1431903 RepID=A0A9P0FF04_BRAAE|nr:unnamed protein product [Brassicogethes aeneus]
MGVYNILGLFTIVSHVLAIDLCREHSSCVPLRKCHPKSSSAFIYPCHIGLNLICCPNSDIQNTTSLETRKTLLFPEECGEITNEKKIKGGKNADLGQFPWMALLGYKQKSAGISEFLCGGTIITHRYIMTAAHCLAVKSRELVFVRLGEHDIDSEDDCVTIKKYTKCADKPVDINVEERIPHFQYNETTLKNDIALLRLELDIPSKSEFIKPICLPFERSLESKDLAGQKFTITGWGKTDPKNLQGSSYLQYAQVVVANQEKCNSNLPARVRNISDSQLCAIGKTEDACKGDSGGPLSNATGDFKGEIRIFQIGIVSFAPTPTCGIQELPPVYTRVDKYLKWIEDTVIV